MAEGIRLSAKGIGNSSQVTPATESSIRSLAGGGNPSPSRSVPISSPASVPISAASACTRALPPETWPRRSRPRPSRWAGILFSERGSNAPGTREGQRLLAHELAHVTQQAAAGDGVCYGLFRKKDEDKPKPPPKKTTKPEDKPKPPPPKTKAPPATTAATPCVPKFKSLKAEITGSVGVRMVNGRCELALGDPDSKPNGTTFTSMVDVPAGCTGELQYVQLVRHVSNFSSNQRQGHPQENRRRLDRHARSYRRAEGLLRGLRGIQVK